MTLKKKVMLALFLVHLIPTITIGLLQHHMIAQERKAEQLDFQKQQWEQVTTEVDDLVINLEFQLDSFLSTYDFFTRFGAQSMSDFIATYESENEQIEFAYWSGAEDQAPPWYTSKSTDTFRWIGPIHTEKGDVYALTGSRYVVSLNRVVAAAYLIPTSELEQMIDAHVLEDNYVLLLDGKTAIGSAAEFQPIDHIRFSDEQLIPLDGTHVMAFYHSVPSQRLEFMVKGMVGTPNNRLTRSHIQTVLLTGLPLFLGVALSLANTWLIWRPFNRLTARVQHISTEKFNPSMGGDYGLFQRTAQLLERELNRYTCAIMETEELDSERNALIAEEQRATSTAASILSQQRHIEQVIEEQEEVQCAIRTTLEEIIVTVSTDGTIADLNTFAESVFSVNKTKLIGKSLQELLVDPDHVNPILSSCQEQFAFKDSTGKKIDLLISTKRIQGKSQPDRILIFGSKRDEQTKIHYRVERRRRELDNIRDITKQLASNHDMEALLGVVVDKICDLYEIAVVGIRMVGNDGRLHLVKRAGSYAHLASSTPIELEEDIRGQAIKERQMRVVDEAESILFSDPLLTKPLMKHMKSCVFIPLIVGDKGLGVISIGFKTKLVEQDMEVLNALAIQSTIAIEKAQLYEKKQDEFVNTIRVLASAIDAKDTYTVGHAHRVARFAVTIGERLGIQQEELKEIELAGILHDIGKIGIPDHILQKKGRLTADEFEVIKKHPEIGDRILSPIGFSDWIMGGVLYHHKRYDGSGYPAKEHASDLPLSSYIIGVADALDAMTSNRSYTSPKTLEQAIAELQRCSGTQFHPRVVDATVVIYQTNADVFHTIIAGKG